MTHATHQITLEILDPDQHTGEETRAELARTLEAEVGAPDDGGLFDLRVEADSREEALQRVADALAALGVEQHFTFPSTTGTDYRPLGHRGVPADERPDDDDEPPHLQLGSPHESEPAPYDPPPRDVPWRLGVGGRGRLRLRADRLVGRLGTLRVRLRRGRRARRRLLRRARRGYLGEFQRHVRLRIARVRAPVPDTTLNHPQGV